MSDRANPAWLEKLEKPSDLLGYLESLLLRYLNGVEPQNDLDEITAEVFGGDDALKGTLKKLKENLESLTPDQRSKAYGPEFSGRDPLSAPVAIDLLQSSAAKFIPNKVMHVNPGLVVLDDEVGVVDDQMLPSVALPRFLTVDKTDPLEVRGGLLPIDPKWFHETYEIFFEGLYCEVQTGDEGVSGSDEPYVIWLGINADTGAKWTVVSAEFSNVKEKQPISYPHPQAPIRIYGPEKGSSSAVMLVVLCESDQSTIGEMLLFIDATMAWISAIYAYTYRWMGIHKTGAETLVPGVGLAVHYYDLLRKSGLVDWALSPFVDDILGTQLLGVFPHGLPWYAHAKRLNHQGVPYHWWTRHLSYEEPEMINIHSDYYLFYTARKK